jgi:hypothetical protein
MVCVCDPSYKGGTGRKIMIQGQTQDSYGNTITLDLNIIKGKNGGGGSMAQVAEPSKARS